MEIEELEKMQNELKKHYITGAVITLIVIVLVAIFISKGITFSIAFIVIGVFVTKYTAHKKEREYRKAYKQHFVLKSLERVFTNLKYEPQSGFSYEKLASTQMINMGDIYRSEDYISAKYKDIAFEQADVHIEEEHTTTDADRTSTKRVCYDIQRKMDDI